ncbi:MAG: Uncharacterized protein DUF983 associated with cytochrome c oxidase? [uncultured Sphingomonas sp.]|uniref:Uncharacterized protein DUF983 associated with cytochrome c oxidase n=1 Tax=uncultured Sphingomonas sp. TaxID=158754 RepID=A0A6J4S9J3_9SPHN|nr:DUF983 domain-containing protein [uncultured Sphingomonas sp.]CAA9493352.1 MAG: Uncharacterized protein DUF983 associated with cytochrome c oxidase? [uncultured Sphingomonas sp.]
MTGAPAGPHPPPLVQALRGSCPRCGEGKLFRGPVQFADRCSGCALDFSQFNVGDGPAAFLILIVGAVLTVGALLLDAAAEPPWWMHLIWFPVGLFLTLGGLRLAKGWLLGAEYRNRAREGRLVR